jgi:hypothetical protein
MASVIASVPPNLVHRAARRGRTVGEACAGSLPPMASVIPLEELRHSATAALFQGRGDLLARDNQGTQLQLPAPANSTAHGKRNICESVISSPRDAHALADRGRRGG